MCDKDCMIAKVVEECKLQDITDSNQIKYILATIEHETNGTFQPVVEAYWVRDKMIKRRGKVKGKKRFNDWAKRHFRYYPYYGRGLVQITWKRNYKRFSKILTELYNAEYIDLVKNPDFALVPDFAVKIAVYGMKHGVFTGKKLEDYINSDKVDFVNARKIINGEDKKEHIAYLAEKFNIEEFSNVG